MSTFAAGRVDHTFISHGSQDCVIHDAQASDLLDDWLARLGPLKRVLLIPPDITRLESWSGPLTCMLYEKLGSRSHLRIMPALGTHFPMSADQLNFMYPGIPHDLFLPHDWRSEVSHLGEVPTEFVRHTSGGAVDYGIPVMLNRVLLEGNWDQIISIGQAVPHEVVGIANHNKNVFVGVGGAEMINKTHYLGAAYGMERIMGRAETPVRAVFDYAERAFAAHLPISYLLTVRGKEGEDLVTRGLYAGSGKDCFTQAARLARQVNIHYLTRRPTRMVVHMAAHEYHSTWLANKAVYRTRMAIADGGELLVIAPGVKTFGEKPEIDAMIRKHGYRGTPYVGERVKQDELLAASLSAAAHLMHGSSEGRFTIRYATNGLSRHEIEGVGYAWANLDESLKRYPPHVLKQGWNNDADGDFYYINTAGQGLWAAEGGLE